MRITVILVLSVLLAGCFASFAEHGSDPLHIMSPDNHWATATPTPSR